MPQVPRLTRQVDTAPIPGVRRQAHETPLSEGAGLEQARAQKFEALAGAGEQLIRTGYGVGQIAMEERRRADEVAVLNAENQLAKWENHRLYDPKQGALGVRGRDSFGLPESVGAEFNDVASTIEHGLATDRQRAAFARVRQNRELSVDLTLRRHVAGEMQRYEAGELQAFIENTTSHAIANATDPRVIGADLQSATDAIKRFAPRAGLGPEQVQDQITKVTSATHVGVIDQLLATDQTKSAQVYFEETRGAIKGEAIARIEKALQESSTRKRAQEETDKILAAGGSLTDQREKAKGIEDPQTRDAVMQRLEHEAAIKEREDRVRDETTLRGVYDIVDQTHDVTKIPATTWATLEGSQRSALRGYANALARGVPVETDLPTYYALMQQAADDPEMFTKQNLLNYRAKLGETEFKQFASMQASLRSGDRKKADHDLGAFRTHDQLLKDTLTQYGIDPTPKDGTAEAKAIAQLRRMLDVRMQAFGEITGKKPSNDDIQQTLDDLLSQSVTVPGSWWNIFPGGQPFFDKQKRVLDLTIGDVPANDRTLIERALRTRGRPVTDATVLDLYIETKARNR